MGQRTHQWGLGLAASQQPVGKALGVPAGHGVVMEANPTPSCVNQGTARRFRELVVLFLQHLKPHPKLRGYLGPQHKRNTDKVERNASEAKEFWGWTQPTYCHVCLEKRQQKGNLTRAFNYQKQCLREDRAKLLSQTHDNRPRANSQNLQQGKFRIDTRTRPFTASMVQQWEGCLGSQSHQHPCRQSKFDRT